MIKFKIGDRVMANGGYDNRRFRNAAGTVIGFHFDTLNPCIEFDKHMGGHSGDPPYQGKYGHCWFVRDEILSPLCKCNTLGCEGGCNDKIQDR